MDHIRSFSDQNQTTGQFYVKRDYVGPKLSYKVKNENCNKLIIWTIFDRSGQSQIKIQYNVKWDYVRPKLTNRKCASKINWNISGYSRFVLQNWCELICNKFPVVRNKFCNNLLQYRFMTYCF